MNEVFNFLRKNNIKALGYHKNKSAVIIETKNKKYVLKDKANNDKILKYLENRSYPFFPKPYISNGKYELMEYIENNDITKYDKAVEIINLISLLHNKTTYYEDIDIDDYKKIYEDLSSKISNLVTYFNDINNFIDEEIYMSPSNYLLSRNISKIYASLDFCKKELDEFYNLILESKKSRKVIIHNNLELDHLVKEDDSYLISWNKAKKDIPVYDIYNLYKNVYNDVEFASIYKIYESKYPLHEEEKKLFFVLISLPNKIVFTSDEYNNCKEVNKLLKYITITESFISPYYANKQKEEDYDLAK